MPDSIEEFLNEVKEFCEAGETISREAQVKFIGLQGQTNSIQEEYRCTLTKFDVAVKQIGYVAEVVVEQQRLLESQPTTSTLLSRWGWKTSTNLTGTRRLSTAVTTCVESLRDAENGSKTALGNAMELSQETTEFKQKVLQVSQHINGFSGVIGEIATAAAEFIVEKQRDIEKAKGQSNHMAGIGSAARSVQYESDRKADDYMTAGTVLSFVPVVNLVVGLPLMFAGRNKRKQAMQYEQLADQIQSYVNERQAEIRGAEKYNEAMEELRKKLNKMKDGQDEVVSELREVSGEAEKLKRDLVAIKAKTSDLARILSKFSNRAVMLANAQALGEIGGALREIATLLEDAPSSVSNKWQTKRQIGYLPSPPAARGKLVAPGIE